MALNYWMMVERYSYLKEEVVGPIPAVKSPLYLTETWRWPIGLLSQKREKNTQRLTPDYLIPCGFVWGVVVDRYIKELH